MAYDEGLAQLFRDDLADTQGIEEKRMFGGLCFMLHGNMLCGVHKNGAMFRVGKDNEHTALALSGVSPMNFTGRKMGGMVDMDEEAFANDDLRHRLLAIAREFVSGLPAK